MDQAVLAYYRRLLKENFPNAGELDHPSIFVEAVGAEMINCGEGNSMQLYLQVSGRRITGASYLCICEPAANVAVEVLCTLLHEKTLEEAAGLTEEPFYQVVGSRDRELDDKVVGLLALLKDGIARYQQQRS